MRGAAIVHTAELVPWFAVQPARLRRQLGYRLAVTVWETIPFRSALRTSRAAANREIVLEATDLFLPTTDRAARCLRLEGVGDDRIQSCSPGIDVERFAARRVADARRHLIVSPGRLVWEKGHYDVIRALATLGGDARLLIVGAGRRARSRLLRYAADLGLSERVEIRAVPYDEMPAVFATASCVVLASLPIPTWEEQFGLVLPEALAARAPIAGERLGRDPRGARRLRRRSLPARRLDRAGPAASARGRSRGLPASASPTRPRSSSATRRRRPQTASRPPTSACSHGSRPGHAGRRSCAASRRRR